MTTLELDGLKIGDLISLKSAKWEAFLNCEGILLDDLVLSDLMEEFDDCIFAVHLQRQYSASRELESFLETYKVDAASVLDDSMKQYLKALEKGRDNEIRLNDVYMNNKIGQPVNFGDIIQLFHVKSRKYLVTNPKVLALAERENSRLALHASGNINSWLQFVPRFKIDRDGDRILSGAEAYIRVAERPNEFIHAAEKKPQNNREVNCSMEKTSWRCCVYQNAEFLKLETAVLASQLVYIHDAETRSNITIATRPLESLDEPRDQATPMDGDEDTFEDYIHDFGDIVLTPMQGDAIDSRSVWMLETISITDGGPLTWKTEHCRFKNINSGLYLRQKKAITSDVNGQKTEKYILTSTLDPSRSGTQFHFFEANTTSKYLNKAKALQIANGSQWLARGEHFALDFKLKCCSEKADAVSLLINDYTPFRLEGREMEREPLDIFSGLSTRKYIKKYLDMTEIPQNRSINTLWPNAERNDISFFQETMARCRNFTQGFMISDEHITLGVDKSDQNLRKERQKLVREQGIVEMIMRIVNKLKPITELYDKGKRSKNALTEGEQSVVRFGNMILDEALQNIYFSILDCPENQMHVADFLPDLLAHLSSQQMAGKCVTAMLSTNMELQETKIGSREISIFVDKLRSSKMNSMYLNLLQSCCSCQGQGVDANQCRVAETLFEDTNDIVIQLLVDYTKVTPCDWGDSIYIPSEPVLGSPVDGQVLVDKGLPQLALAWTTNAIDFSPLGLFGKLSVNVADLYKILEHQAKSKNLDLSPEKLAAMKKAKAKAEASNRQKEAVADYFINEMYLGAEMCMDRNYVAMHKLDDLFSFEALVSIMKMDVQNRVKAGACRLLFCLHVDRDPQVGTKIPCLTRTWSETVKDEKPRLPFVEPARQNVYALIQQLISEHVAGMKGRRWDMYSNYILQMLLGMLKFNFYGSIERLQDVITPIISAIDRRAVDYTGKAKGKSDGADGGGDDDGEEDEKEEGEVAVKKQVTWQKRHFEQLESLPFMLGILFLVLLAVGITIWQVVADAEETTELFIFGLIVLAIFVYDFFMRLYCYWHTYGNIPKFLCNTFNIIDQVVILIDVVFLALPSDIGGSNANFSKTLRLIRLVRLVRVLRAAKVITRLVSSKVEVIKWNAPSRYGKIPTFELETMTEAINILKFVQCIIEDRNLSLLLKKFYLWEANVCGGKTPGDLFADCVDEFDELTLGIPMFDDIFIDAIMFKHMPLVQGTLEVVMKRHSMQESLLEAAKGVQLLISPKRERQFRLVSATVQTLERNAETHELWGELESDLDHATNKQTKEILEELIDLCRVRCSVLEFGMDWKADPQIQDLLRNLGLFEISLKVLGLLDSVEEDEETGEYEEVALNTQHLCRLCNELLYWFVLENPLNQEIVYENLDFFLGSLDDGINSHRVVRAIFKNNENLMKLVPSSYLTDMADKIAADGHSHHYLALAAAITHVGDKNIIKNQQAIIKAFCGPSRLPKVSCWLVGIHHPDYQQKIEMMKEHNDDFDDNLDNLPPLLAYHLAFLEVLSNCTVGRINITSIEAKVQSIFLCEDIIDAILHEDTSLITKKFLTLHLFNAIIEVEIMIPGLEKNRAVWNLIKIYVDDLKSMTSDITELDRSNWRSEKIPRLRIEYYLSCVMVISGFFARYYDPLALASDDGNTAQSMKNTDVTVDVANTIMTSLYNSLHEFYEYNSSYLSKIDKSFVFEALEALNKSAKSPFYEELDKIHLIEQDEDDREDETALQHELIHEAKIHEKYEEFLQALEDDEDLQASISNESNAFVQHIESMAFLADSSEDEIRFEPFIQKLVAHVRENLSQVDDEMRMNSDCTATTTWVIKIFRTMIENAMGMSIYDRDDDGGEEQDIAAGPVVTALNENGVTGLCIELIAPGIDETLQSEVIKLLVGMLFKEGGAREVQGSMHSYLMKNNSELFFKQTRAILQKLIAWHRWNEVIILEEDEDPEPPEDILIVRMLQLMSEGHYLPNQDIMREQPANLTQVNLLDDFVTYFNCLSRLPCKTSTDAGIRVGATIVEIIQGPCTGNQKFFALNTEVLEVINRILRSKPVNDCEKEQEIELKKTCLDTISALLEGQTPTDQVTERILSVLHLDIVIALSKASEFDDDDKKELSDEEVDLQTDCGVLLQMLCDYKPQIKAELEAEGGIEMNSETTGCVEISWDGVLNRRFFNVPDICSLLAKSSKDRLVQEVDRSNPENKLIDFLERSKGLYREVKHQEYLTQQGVATVFSQTNADYATWFTFVLAVVINAIMIAYYSAANEERVAVLAEGPTQTVSILNYIQMAVSFFTMVLMFVVRAPVVAQALREDNYTDTEVILYTAFDPKTLYYVIYLIISMLGQWVEHYYLCLLLLDIVVKDVTTADVLNAVIQPRKQLGYALLLGGFVTYIFAFYTFFYFRHYVDSDGHEIPFCNTLYDCLKMCISYGLQNGGGIADNMYHAKSYRLILDLAWFIVVLVVFINIIFGIVIDTFSSLRADKNERMTDTTEFCFICSIGRQTFDRNSDVPDGFKNHIRNDHNMWNYLNFIFFLWEQDKDDDDGLEYYVRHKIYGGEITWFPMHKAMCLNQALSESEALSEDLKGCVVETGEKLSHAFVGHGADIKKLLVSLEDTLQDPTFIHGEDGAPDKDDGNLGGTRYDGLSEAKDWEVSWGYNASMTIMELRGMEMSEEELLQLNFRLISDSGMYTNEASSTNMETKSAIFHQEFAYLVGEGRQLNDTRSFQIQILQKSSSGVAKFVSVVEIQIAELMAGESGAIVEKIFVRAGQAAPCKLVVKAEFAKAKYAIGGDDDSDEN